MTVRIKRIYESRAPTDGTRVLVDRLWPRGVKKTDAHVDLWMKDVAPSARLRQWFQHDPERFDEFRRRYLSELKGNPGVTELRNLGRDKPVTLLYAAHDPQINNARVLQEALGGRGAKPRAKSSAGKVRQTRKPTPPGSRATARG